MPSTEAACFIVPAKANTHVKVWLNCTRSDHRSTGRFLLEAAADADERAGAGG